MAQAVEEVIDGPDEDGVTEICRMLVVEAETGIGKTLAYLVPGILSGKRIVVSTATLNLQDQIMNKEVPLIARALGRDVPVLCIKGRQNYLCLYRWYQNLGVGLLPVADEIDFSRIGKWLEHTRTGDRAELDWLPERSPLWARISASSSQCLGGECPEEENCFVTRLRKQAGSVSLLVVNHHLFFSDLALRQGGFGEVLPRYEGVIFDEAHHIENVATSFFGRTFSLFQVLDLVADIERQAEADLDPDRFDRMVGGARGLKQRTEEFASLFPVGPGKFHLSEFIRTYSRDNWQQEVQLLATGLERLAKDLGGCADHGEGWKNLERRAAELRGLLLDISLNQDQEGATDCVYWYERRERSLSLSATPIHVASHLQKALYGAVKWCVLTSATLSSAGDFRYLRERLGLPESVRCLRFPSPFDYGGRSLLYVPKIGFPEPSSQEYMERACAVAADILHLSRGRGMVLCTSFRSMEIMADYLQNRLDYPLLVQGRGSRSSLLQQFREESDSVLVAVASFWEGVDVQGEALSCVIIDKLPFEVPTDPVIQARIQAVTENGQNGFFDFQVPRAILTLRQGVGRLMRAATDRGVIAVLDVRLFTKGYGRRFLASLPPAPVVRTLQPLADFYGTSPTE